MASLPPPLLARYPDARRGWLPLFQPALLGYLALVPGPAVSGVIAFWNAVSLRRAGLASASLLIAALAWVACGNVVEALYGGGMRHFPLMMLAARCLNVLIGVLLGVLQWRHARGHAHLEGRMVPLLPSVLAGLAVMMLAPARALLAIEGFWQVLFRG